MLPIRLTVHNHACLHGECRTGVFHARKKCRWGVWSNAGQCGRARPRQFLQELLRGRQIRQVHRIPVPEFPVVQVELEMANAQRPIEPRDEGSSEPVAKIKLL